MTVAARVELYISKRPHLKRALSEGVINYSALARKIAEEEEIDSQEAIKAALSRLEEHLSDRRNRQRQQVRQVLSETEITLRDGVKVVKPEMPQPDSIVEAKTSNGYTSVLPDGDRSLVTLVSPEKLEETPGVIEFILASMAAEGINVDHLISCREDTHLVVHRKDAPQVLELLQERI